jgi:uncharacterized membrane protein
MILRAIAERGGIVGAIGAAIVGVAWNVATFLAIPVLVMEGVGPIEAVKRSGGLLKRTWGEQVVGNVGISLVFGLLILAVILVGVALVAGTISVGAAVSGIFTASLYRYVTKGDGGPMFPTSTLQQAFRPKG